MGTAPPLGPLGARLCPAGSDPSVTPRRPLGVSTVTSPGRSAKRDNKKASRKEAKKEEAEMGQDSRRVSSAQVLST